MRKRGVVHDIINYLYTTLFQGIMKKLFIFFIFTLVLVLSGCIGEKTVKEGDKVSIDYIATLQNGKVFDTSIESVAKQHNIFNPHRRYKPLQFTVGKGEVVQGLDEGVVGMKVGDTKTLTIPPEKGYGMVDPKLIKIYPIIEHVPTTFPRIVELPREIFEASFGKNHHAGDTITSNSINLTILNISSSNVTLSYDFKVGDRIPSSGAPWNQTVVKVDEKNITVKYSVKKNDTIQFPNVPWNTTVIDVSADNITLRHNPIPDTVIQTMFGPIRVSFNKTSIIMDRNHKLAGKTLIFKVTLKSIE